MKLRPISSVLIPASAILLQFVLWNSPVAHAADSLSAQDSAEYAVSADDKPDSLSEIEGDEQIMATCPSSNKVNIKYCKDPDYGYGVCHIKAGCTYNSVTDSECKKDFKAVCGYVPGDWRLDF